MSLDGQPVPAFLFDPGPARGGIVVSHGYGSSKEEWLGMAAYLAHAGFAVLAIDLRGHGENTTPIGAGVLDDLMGSLAYMRRYGSVAAVGHSLSGRLSLMTDADAVVAIAPSVVQEVSQFGTWMFENLPSPFVREPYSGYVINLLKELGDVPAFPGPALLVVSTRDIPNIIAGTKALAGDLPRAELREITDQVRPDISSDQPLMRYLPRWFNHIEIRANRQLLGIVPAWLQKHLG
jgi:pimeloyl-ACP methyl ester carboxylesterase